MRKGYNKIYFTILGFCFLAFFSNIRMSAQGFGNQTGFSNSASDTSEVKFPVKQDPNYPYDKTTESPLYLKDPSNIEEKVEFNEETNEYEVSKKAGSLNLSPPVSMSIDEYNEYKHKQALNQYWQQRARGENYDSRSSFIPSLTIGGEGFDKVFGSNTIDIKPQGSVELIFGYNQSRIDNPAVSEKLRKTPSFTFEEKIQMNVTGSIGDKFELGINYNTEATFKFENKTKLEYSGKEDEIIKKIEAGNVTLPLTGSLITGSQSLFGLKTELQFGKLYVTTVFSQQDGETSVIEMEGGAQMNEFEVEAVNYDANKHFFLSQYFRDNYEEALKNLPIISSPINITKLEVWVTNKTGNYEDARDILAITDLGEINGTDNEGGQYIYNPYFRNNGGTIPGNAANSAYQTLSGAPGIRSKDNVKTAIEGLRIADFTLGEDYENLDKARKLKEREYKFHPNLGYISLNTALNSDEILAVAFEFTYNGRTYKVGEFSNDQADPQILLVKMLKGTNLSPKYPPTWNLMMKNVYSIGAYQLNPEDFELNILYLDDKTGTAIPYIREGSVKNELLLKVFNLDRVNVQGDPKPDGIFDFYENVTIYSSNGRIFFPTTKPFGSFLRQKIIGENSSASQQDQLNELANNYVYDELYDQTQTVAKQKAEKNKFIIKGRYKSSSSNEIMLNAMNVPRGSVKVTAGGRMLTEGSDYTVDYTLGRVKIINQGLLESGTPIKVSLENNSLFNIQTKTLVGTNLNYRFSDNFILGGTILKLNERPLTKKVNIGDEPVSNTIWGLNGSYQTESQWLTTMIDKLPLIETKEPSSISLEGEFAQLIPGQSKTISKSGIAYIDDFEGTETSIEMKIYHTWKLASTPQHQDQGNGLFPEGGSKSLAYGYNRSKLSWYNIDPLFLRGYSSTPDYIQRDEALRKSHYVREVYEKEIFPEKDRSRDEPPTLNILNLAYYPDEIGPYNFVVNDVDSLRIRGIDDNGKLLEPETRWAGITREINTNDFEEANVEFIEFWLMDPYVENPDHNGGDLYFNLGDISEDVLRDSRQSFENGLPASNGDDAVTKTEWARVPKQYVINRSFDVDENKRKYQDVGLDGAGNDIEGELFSAYADSLRLHKTNYYNQIISPDAEDKKPNDFAHDDFHYYRGNDYDNLQYDILQRYKNYSNPDGNSPVNKSDDGLPNSATLRPDAEDINEDNTLNESENYYQYRVSLSPNDLNENNPYITNIVTSTEKDHEEREVQWYQFKIPVKEFDNQFGSIDGFKSIRFMRMFLKGFAEPVVLRFAKLELIRSEWRKYELELLEQKEELTGSDPYQNSSFDVLSVNIEENSTKDPIEYVLPPDIDRAIDPTNPQLQQQNEQSIVLRVRELGDGAAYAAFKNIDMDMRQYTKLKMDVHAEELAGNKLDDYELVAFIRLGSDYTGNYYEYQVPLKLTRDDRHFANTSDEDRKLVWPRENFFNIDLQSLLDAKQKRNDEIRKGNTELSVPFTYRIESELENAPDRLITVKGNPSLSDVRIIMIGILNPSGGLIDDRNDGLPKSVEVWMNELRLTNFKDDGGWAANGRFQTRLADLGSFNVAGSIITPGFGSIEKKVNERAKEEIVQYDVSTNLELGKLFPEKAKVTIPMYVGFSEQIINPQYNPLDKDIPLQSALNLAESEAEKNSILDKAQDRTTRKSINFTNVKVNQQSKKPMPWDPANFSVSYSYNEIDKRDNETLYDWEFNHRGTFYYLYNLRPTNVQPLRKVKFLNNKYAKIIQDFNFYYLPSKISYRTDVIRNYSEVKKRNLNENDLTEIAATADRNFLWNWYFDLKFDLARSLKLDYSASNMARFDEEEIYFRQDRDSSDYDYIYTKWKRELLREIQKFGDNTDFNHKINANYTIPVNKIPFLDWTSLSTRYSGTYDWIAGPKLAVPIDPANDEAGFSYEKSLGNTIKNSNTIQFNNTNQLDKLYNKVGFLKNINQMTGRRPSQSTREMVKVTYEDEGINLFENRAKTIEHRLKTENVTVKVLDREGNEIPVETRIVDQNKVRVTSATENRDVRVIVEGEVEKKENPALFALQHGTRALMAVRNISFSFTQNNATTIPGYGIEHSLETFVYDPGLQYISGWHDLDILKNNLYTWRADSIRKINTPMYRSASNTLNVKSNVEPFNGFMIVLNGSYSASSNYEQYYYDTLGNLGFDNNPIIETGNVNLSILTIKTAFEADSVIYFKFKENRETISERMHQHYNSEINGYTEPSDTLDLPGYRGGFGPTSQQVLIPAFLAAYTGQDVNTITLDELPKGKNLFESFLKMRPNWRITYDGLSKIDFLKRYFRSINLNHQYTSTYSVASYRKNPYFKPESVSGLSLDRNPQGNYETKYEISSVSINEQFRPLIGVDMTWINSMTTRFEIKKSRNISLSLANNQISEMVSDEYVVGLGYRFKEVKLVINQRPYKSDVNVRADISMRDNVNSIRSLAVFEEDELIDQKTAGQKAFSFKFSADYVLNEKFNVRFFIDRMKNVPYVTSSFPTANTDVGFSITFTL